MPFGLSRAPVTFQQLMDNILRRTVLHVRVYLGDTVIHSKTWNEHLMHVEEVLKWLEDAGLSVKLQKCIFGARNAHT